MNLSQQQDRKMWKESEKFLNRMLKLQKDSITSEKESKKYNLQCCNCKLFYESMPEMNDAVGYTCANEAFYCPEQKAWIVYGAYGSTVSDCAFLKVEWKMDCLGDKTKVYLVCDRCLVKWGKDGVLKRLQDCDNGLYGDFSKEDWNLLHKYSKALPSQQWGDKK